jgi:hypothetical protein
MWQEAIRVLKPGGYLLSFAGARTYHRMAVNIEDAGFEIRDQIMWIYGSGFPKSHNIGKAIDKLGGQSLSWFVDYILKVADEKGISRKELTMLFPSKNGLPTGWLWNKQRTQGITVEQFNKIKHFLDLPFKDMKETEREVIGKGKAGLTKGTIANFAGETEFDLTKGNSKWEGWGTALKPAHEPIVVARKTVAQNVLKHGTGGINIDECRVGTEDKTQRVNKGVEWGVRNDKSGNEPKVYGSTKGRFPANFIHDGSDEVVSGFPDSKSVSVSRERKGGSEFGQNSGWNKHNNKDSGLMPAYGDEGSASRFFKTCNSEGKHDIMNVCTNINVNNVINFLRNIHQINGSIVEVIAMQNPNELLAQTVRSAGIRCDSCVTVIAQSLAVMVTGNMASQVIQVCTTDYKNSIPHQNLAEIVKEWENTDIIPTTESLLRLFGSVLLATTNYTRETGETGQSRLIYQAKASKKERNKGLPKGQTSTHPTHKPIKLMQYLCRLITPKDGVTLDPFMGSGSTGVGAKLEGFDFIGIEREEDYIKIAEARIKNTSVQSKLL